MPGSRGKNILLLWFIILSICNSYGQENHFTLRLDSITLHSFADTVEKIAPVKFYYFDKEIDLTRISVNVKNASLDQLLSRSLSNTAFSYYITKDDRILLIKDYSLKTTFRDECIDYLKRPGDNHEIILQAAPPSYEKENTISNEYKLFRIGRQNPFKKITMAVLSGRIINSNDNNPIIGVVVYVGKLHTGTVTDDNGNYSISLPTGQYHIDYRMIGMQPAGRNLIIYSDGILDIAMTENTNEVEAVVITGKRNTLKDVRNGTEKISVKMLKQIPMGFGEVDLLKSSLLLPGVQTVGEASAGFNVRGGSTDQNMIYLDNAPVINPSHLFGLFSAFNSDLIEDIILYKSGMPAKYGGRLSSVMEITQAEGSTEKVKVGGGISPITGRLSIQGPVKKINGSFIVGARTTYSDWLLGMLDDYRLSKSTANFYDIQGHFTSDINKKNSLSFSGYLSHDYFNYYKERAFQYGNFSSSIKWFHAFSKKLTSQMFLINSNYRYNLNIEDDSTQYSKMSYNINQKILRADFTYYHNDHHKFEFGSDATLYSILPGVLDPVGEYSTVISKTIARERALEHSFYFSDEYEVTPLLTVSAGIRGTLYSFFGPKEVFSYQEGNPLSENYITDTINYRAGELIKLYPSIEPRFSARFLITPDLSVKAGVQRVYQYIHMISNTTSMSPTDTWKLSDTYIRPERSDQFSIGLYNTFGKNAIESSVEAYYKTLNNVLDYKAGASLQMNEHLETDVISGKGKAYGVEFMIKKQTGSLTGWISYTYSRTFHKIDGEYESEKVNGGNYFPADYDKPNDLKVVINAKLSRRFNITTNFAYSSGRPITYPVAFYNFDNTISVYYSNRNEYRIPDYIRLDLAATINGNLKAKKLNHSSFTFTVYNVLGRQNPYSIYFRTEDNTIKGYQLSIIGQPIYMVSYNFRILGNALGDF